MNEIENTLDKSLDKLEHGLNIAGYVPILSSFSGGLRAVLGKIEIIGAIAAAAIMAVAALFNPDAAQRQAQLNKALQIAVKYSLHGAANMFRGTVESIPFVSLVTCLPYDLLGHRFAYIREQGNNHGLYYVQQLGSN